MTKYNDQQKLDTLLENLTRIHEISLAQNDFDAFTKIVSSAIANTSNFLSANRGSLMLYNENTGLLEIVAGIGITPELVKSIKLKPGEGIAGKVFETGQTWIELSPQKSSAYIDYIGAPDQNDPLICLPIRTQNKILGVLNIHAGSKEEAQDEKNQKLLAVLAAEIAISLEHYQLYSTMKNYSIEIIETLSRIIDAKDSYTADHAERAREKACKMAQALGLSQNEIMKVEYGALLHDIGKIGISENILRKPSGLTDAEYAEIKKHPEIGYKMIEPVAFLSDVADIVLAHQEWYDGTGYPNKLKGDEIPLGSRIVSIIDAWDAMVSDRPYRKALSKERAVKEIASGMGTQFDPAVAEIFLALEEAEWKINP